MADWAVGGFIAAFFVTWTTYRYVYFNEQELVRAGMAIQTAKAATAKATDPTWKDRLETAKQQKLAEARSNNNSSNSNNNNK